MSIPIEQFCEQGFIAIRGAVAPSDVRACVIAIEAAVRAQNVDLSVRTTWTRPVVRIPCPEGPAFAAAGTSPKLQAAYGILAPPSDARGRRHDVVVFVPGIEDEIWRHPHAKP